MTSRRFLLSTLVAAALVPSARVSGQTPTDSSASPLTVSGSFTQFFQGPNATEGGTTEVEYGGRLDVTARLDTKKLGLWPDGLFTAKAFTRYGDSGNESVNTGIPVSAALIDPATTGTTTALNELTYTHFVRLGRPTDFLTLSLGKFDGFDLITERYLGGGGLTKWMNLAQVVPPHEAINVPTLTPFAGTTGLFLGGEKRATLAILDPSTETTGNGLGDLFANGVTLLGSVILPTRFFGLRGHEELRASWSNRDMSPFAQMPRMPLLPRPARALPTSASSWTFTWTGDQYFENPVPPREGLGAFWLIGLGDAATNPIPFFANIGVSGSSPVLGRGRDSFGMAFGYMKLSAELEELVDPVVPLRAEQEIELFYNLAATPWLRATADLQIIAPFREDQNPILLPGVRIQIHF